MREFIIPVFLISLLGVMILPLPSFLLDFFLVLNFGFSLALLFVAVRIKSPEKFTVLPALLLFLTLFRLALNVGTTRLILSGSEVPEIIVAFGNFVAGGNLAVGFVIFLIISIIQFLVVAKGAERVAEVSARFSLDAMPGKQMSIDADIRSGVLTIQDARDKRMELHRESKLYGALDGAMKFVKGDAIAGLIIVTINIIGGLIIATLFEETSLDEAITKYLIFAIGDGLISQIPAVLVAVAAGIAVTRVSGGESGIATEIYQQIFADHKMLYILVIALLCFAFCPGIPIIPPIFLAGFLLIWGIVQSKFVEVSKNNEVTNNTPFKSRGGVVLKISPKLALELNNLPQKHFQLRKEIYSESGVIIPDCNLEFDLNFGDKEYELYFLGGRVHRSSIKSVDNTAELIAEIKSQIKRHLVEFIDATQVRILLDLNHEQCEDLINTLIPKEISITTLTLLLKELIQDGLSIRELVPILNGIALSAQELDLSKGFTPQLLSNVRKIMHWQIEEQVTNGSQVVSISSELEDLLSQLQITNTPLAPTLINIIENQLKLFSKKTDKIISNASCRLILARVLRGKGWKVYSVEELSDDLSLIILGEVSHTFKGNLQVA